MFEDVDQVADPAVAAVAILAGGPALLVGPVRREAIFGLGVHLLGADLHLDAHLLRMDDRGVERAIAVALRGRDIILEAARHHRPAPVEYAERLIGGVGVLHDHPEGHHVGQLLEADVALGHFAPDRIGVLLAALDLDLDPGAAELEAQARADPRDDVAAALVKLVEPLGDRGVGVGLELLEGERLHLAHELVHADPLGERRVDVHRLAGDAQPLRLGLDVMEGAHVVQPVGQLDQQHADVARHGEEEFAQILGGALIFGLRLDLRQLGDAVDEPRDRRPEALLDLLGGRQRILDRVVEDRGGDRLVVELEVGQYAGDLDRMAEIGIAAGALLAAMRLHRKDIGTVEQRLVGVRIVG